MNTCQGKVDIPERQTRHYCGRDGVCFLDGSEQLVNFCKTGFAHNMLSGNILSLVRSSLDVCANVVAAVEAPVWKPSPVSNRSWDRLSAGRSITVSPAQLQCCVWHAQ